jgi:predicted phage-related endonuclease
MSDWDTYINISNRSDLERMAEEFLALSRELENTKDKLEKLSDGLSTEFSDESGEAVLVVGGKYAVICNRTERWQWDTEILEEILEEHPSLPDHVKRSLSVDKRRFQQLDDAEQKALLPALTRKAGKAQIKVAEVA